MEENGPCNFNLDRGQRAGLGITVGTGFISAVAIIWLLSLVARNLIANFRKPHPGFKLIRTHIDVYFVSLIIADLIQSVGAMVNLKWVIEGHTYCSHHCTAQGALKEIGEAGVAMSTLAIALHTFLAIFFQWVPPRTRWIPSSITAGIWGFLLIFMAVNVARHPWYSGMTTDPYYAPSPFWCWVGKSYTTQRITGEYGWLWACAFVSIILYIPLYFCLRGNIVADPRKWWRITFHRRQTFHEDAAHVTGITSRKEATKMLVYPITYTILVLPLSIGRWATYGTPSPSYGAAKATDVSDAVSAGSSAYLALLIGIPIFGLSGLVNVVLFMITRPKLLSLNSQEAVHRSTSSPNGNFRQYPRSPRANQISFFESRSQHLDDPDHDHDPIEYGDSKAGDLSVPASVVLTPLTPSAAAPFIISADEKRFAAFRNDAAHRVSDFQANNELMSTVERNRSPVSHLHTRSRSSSAMDIRLGDLSGGRVTPGLDEGPLEESEDLHRSIPRLHLFNHIGGGGGDPAANEISSARPAAVNVQVTVERSYM